MDQFFNVDIVLLTISTVNKYNCYNAIRVIKISVIMVKNETVPWYIITLEYTV